MHFLIKYFCLLFLCISSYCTRACDVDNLFISTQAQVDSFALLYPDCDTLHGDLSIYSFDIVNLAGLSQLKAVTGILTVSGNYSNVDLDLSFMQSVGWFSVTSTSGLQSITLAPTVHIKDHFTLLNNTDLNNVETEQIISQTIGVRIVNNDALESIPSFNGIDTLESLTVTFCKKLESIDGFHDVVMNKSVTTLSRLESLKELIIYNNLVDHLDDIDLTIGSLVLDTFEGFYMLRNARKSIAIRELINTRHLPSFDALIEAGSIQISYCGASEVTGFSNLGIVHDQVYFSNIPAQTFNAFQTLDSVGNQLVLQLENVTTITGFSNLKNVKSLIITCPNITSLPRFELLDQVLSSIDISCRSIANIDGFNSLAKIGPLTVINGPRLRLQYNYNLKDITGFQKLILNPSDSIVIDSNPLLNVCNAIPICNYLDMGGERILLAGNATGCNSKSEVRESCESVRTADVDWSEVRMYPNPVHNHLTINYDLELPLVGQIYNNLGQLIMTLPTVKRTIQLSDLAPGVYRLVVTHESTERKSLPFVKL